MPTGRPFMLYDSILDRPHAVITCPSDTGYPIANAIARRPQRVWKLTSGGLKLTVDLGAGKAEEVTCVAFTNHSVYRRIPPGGASVRVEYSADGVAWLDALPNEFGPELPWTFIREWTSVGQFRWWRVTTTATPAVSYCGAIGLGRHIEFPEAFDVGFDPDNWKLKNRVNRGRDGGILGVSNGWIEGDCVLDFGPAGWDRNAFTLTDDESGKGDDQWPTNNTSETYPTNAVSWEHFVRTCYSNGRPFWIKWNPDNVMHLTRDRGLFVMPSDGASYDAPFNAPQRRKPKLKLDSWVDLVGEPIWTA